MTSANEELLGRMMAKLAYDEGHRGRVPGRMSMPNADTPDLVETVRAMKAQGKNDYEIADACGVGEARIAGIRSRNGIAA